MSVTALVWVALYCAALVMTFANPLFGALGYLLEYYMRPELKWWGKDLPALRYNLIIAVTLGVAFLMRRSSLRELAPVKNPVLPWLLGLGGTMVLVSLTVALNWDLTWQWTTQWIKMAVIFPLLLVGVLRSRKALDWFLVAHMLGAFWWGWDSWVDPKRSAGRLISVGSGDSLDDNAASAHLLTVLPFCLVYLFTVKDKLLRGVALLATPFIINTIILCNSRGSTLGLLVALTASLGLVRRPFRMRAVWLAVAAVLVFFLMADQQWLTRQQSTTNYEADNSAASRLITWRGAYELVKDRPFGSGGRGFHLQSPRYIPEIVAAHEGNWRAPHNTVAMVASEWGVLGLFFYLGLMYTAIFTLPRHVKRRAADDGDNYFYWRALAVQLGLIAYFVAGLFSDRLYGEAGYWMIALSYALYRVQLTDQVEAGRVVLQPTGEPIALRQPAASVA